MLAEKESKSLLQPPPISSVAFRTGPAAPGMLRQDLRPLVLHRSRPGLEYFIILSKRAALPKGEQPGQRRLNVGVGPGSVVTLRGIRGTVKSMG